MEKYLDRIETERLILRGINETDTDRIVCWRSEEKVYKYFKQPHKITIEEHNNWYQKRYLNNTDRYDWMCLEKGSANRVGIFGLVRDNTIAEVNYILSPEEQHKGYASEGVSALVEYAFFKWKVKKVIAEIHKDNQPSIVFINRLGFELELDDGMFRIYSKRCEK